uniref:C2H2-type domain-containing protein n=1 Tax=Periophthalmus magnuspinnatus TaxID=409849 RepID=A0A3B3ZEH8_9GOBI
MPNEVLYVIHACLSNLVIYLPPYLNPPYVHSRWTPTMLRNPHLLLNTRTPQQNLSNAPNVTLSVSSTLAPSTSTTLNQTIQTSNSQKYKIGKKYVCKLCGKLFPAWSNLEIHQRVHTGERPFKCETCGKRFSEAGNLKKHQRVHTGEKPFSCNKCGKTFAWICNLKTHQQSTISCMQQGLANMKLRVMNKKKEATKKVELGNMDT